MQFKVHLLQLQVIQCELFDNFLGREIFRMFGTCQG